MSPAAIAEVNYGAAVDQRHNYGGLLAALESYADNAADTAGEYGVSVTDTLAAFHALVRKNHPEIDR